MPGADRIKQRLPELYRPDPMIHGNTLLADHIDAAGDALDQLAALASEVMQSHWFRYADSALIAEYTRLFRLQGGQPPLTPSDKAILDDYPHLASLPRIAALLDLAPWREPSAAVETVEDFRRRVLRTVNLYREGLGTIPALRLATATALPVFRDSAGGRRERTFTLEECASCRRITRPASVSQDPAGRIGPLMAFGLNGESKTPVAASAFIEGQQAVAGDIDATTNPLLERFDVQTNSGIGIAWEGTVAPGETLAIVPAWRAWSAGTGGINSAQSVPQGIEAVDPTVSAGVWTADAAAPTGNALALLQTRDGFLWAAADDSGDFQLWRSDGDTWQQMASGLPAVHCFIEDGDALLVGFDGGLARLPLFQENPVFDPDPGSLGGPAIRALVRFADDTLWAATSLGLARVDRSDNDTLIFSALGATAPSQTSLNSVFQDQDGSVFLGADSGLFLWRPRGNQWFFYSGADADDQVPDWQPFEPGADPLPTGNEVFLPRVNHVIRGPDSSLWLATDRGIARYYGARVRRTSTSLLQAVPWVSDAPVRHIAMDARQRLWFSGAQGIFVHDGNDWLQRTGDRLVLLSRPPLSPALEFWRFSRAAAQWQVLAEPARDFVPFVDPPLASAEPAVAQVIWTDGAAARLVSRDGDVFSALPQQPVGTLRMRFKPEATRIIDGGIPALPRVGPQTTIWRYLALEPDPVPQPSSTPAWTIEGRLLPPPDQARSAQPGRFPLAVTDVPNRVFAFCPSARVWFSWSPREAMAVTVRLGQREPNEVIDPLIIDRVWKNITRVRPAGVKFWLAVGEQTVRGDSQ